MEILAKVIRDVLGYATLINPWNYQKRLLCFHVSKKVDAKALFEKHLKGSLRFELCGPARDGNLVQAFCNAFEIQAIRDELGSDLISTFVSARVDYA